MGRVFARRQLLFASVGVPGRASIRPERCILATFQHLNPPNQLFAGALYQLMPTLRPGARTASSRSLPSGNRGGVAVSTAFGMPSELVQYPPAAQADDQPLGGAAKVADAARHAEAACGLLSTPARRSRRCSASNAWARRDGYYCGPTLRRAGGIRVASAFFSGRCRSTCAIGTGSVPGRLQGSALFSRCCRFVRPP